MNGAQPSAPGGGAGPPHVIRRQVLELTLARPLSSGTASAEQEARRFQEEAGRAFHRRVLPAIDRVLSEAAGAGEVVRLGRLELDLGELAPEDFAGELVRRTETELARSLAERIATLGSEPAAGGELRLDTEQAGLRWLGVFLVSGVLPWWVPEAVAADPEAALAGLLETAPAALAATLRQAAGPRAARRLVRQFSPPLRRELLALLAAEGRELEETIADWHRLLAGSLPELGTPIAVVDRWLERLMAEPPAGAPALSRLAVATLAAAAGTDPAAAARVLLAPARRRLPPGNAVRGWLEETDQRVPAEHAGGARSRSPDRREADDAPAVPAGAPAVPLPDVAAAPTPEEHPRPRHLPSGRRSDSGATHRAAGPAEDEELAPPPVHPPPLPRADRPGEPPLHTSAATPVPRAAASSDEEPRLVPGEALFVDDAGLVLLAPFLPAYLEKLDLVEERAFVSETARERAVLLLRYLATGAAEAFEHCLTLDKLLCGWPLEEPVARAIEPTPVEEEESGDLLASVVDHWQGLGNTSVDGLRGSFLAREGRLIENDQGWQLTVARTGWDVLLDQLPWGFGTVLLPWMEKPLFVEW